MPIMVYITAPNEDEARRIGLELVEKKLAACVNILPGMKSIYIWQGALEQSEEVVLIAKTVKERFNELCAAVKEAHSYEVPCIVSWPITEGTEDFLAFIRDNVR